MLFLFFSSHVWFILQADGRAYTWGRGFPGFSDAHSPVELPSLLPIKQIALGWNHALVLMGTSSQLCIKIQPIYSWHFSTAHHWQACVCIYHTDGGDAFILGGNRHGVLGNPEKLALANHTTGSALWYEIHEKCANFLLIWSHGFSWTRLSFMNY